MNWHALFIVILCADLIAYSFGDGDLSTAYQHTSSSFTEPPPFKNFTLSNGSYSTDNPFRNNINAKIKNTTTFENQSNVFSDMPLGDDGDVVEPIPSSLIYEVFPSADDIITNNTRCSYTQLSFTKETLLHVWEIKGLIGYISYIKRFDQPFEVKTDNVNFKSENTDGKWTFKVHKVRHHSPFSIHSSSASPSTVSSSATSSGYAVVNDVGDIRIVATYAYEAKQPRNSDFVIRPTIIHGSKEIILPPQKSSSPTIIQQKFYNTRGYQLNTNFLEYVYTFTWTNLLIHFNEIKNELFKTKLSHFDNLKDNTNRFQSGENDESSSEPFFDEASEEFFEEITKTDVPGLFGDVTLKFIIQAYFPDEPMSVTSSRCNSSLLDIVVTPNLYDKLVSSGRTTGHYSKDRTRGGGNVRNSGNFIPPYLRYANSMIYDDRFMDVILVAGEDEIPAHRIILATSSPVFSAILENTSISTVPPAPSSKSKDQAGCQGGPPQVYLPRIHIEPPNVGLDCLEEFLRYIYTGSVDSGKMKDGHIADRLVLLADKYNLLELKRYCEGVLLQELTADNAVEMYLLGTRVSSERITRKSLIVMKMNKAKLASQTEEFRELSMRHPTLMYELFLSD